MTGEASWTTVDPVTSILQTALDVAKKCLAGTTAGVPKRAFICPGEAVWDTEQLWVRASRTYVSPGGVGAEPAGRQIKAPVRSTVEIEIGVLRCVHAIQKLAGNNFAVPTSVQMTEDALKTLDDARALRAIGAHAWTNDYVDAARRNLKVGNWLPVGPEGKLAGGLITISVPFEDCKPTFAQ